MVWYIILTPSGVEPAAFYLFRPPFQSLPLPSPDTFKTHFADPLFSPSLRPAPSHFSDPLPPPSDGSCRGDSLPAPPSPCHLSHHTFKTHSADPIFSP